MIRRFQKGLPLSIRADIDPQDIANLQRDMRKRFTRDSISLAATATLLTAFFAGAGLSAWRAFTAIAQTGAAPLVEKLVRAARAASPEFVTLVLCAAIMTACIAAAALTYKARRARLNARKRERIKHGVTIGRFDYQFTEGHLVIKGPLALKKIAWSAIVRIENAKSALIFHNYDGTFEFLPKNAIKQNGLLEVLQKNHGAAIRSNLSFDEAVHAKPLSVSFECTPADLAEYRACYHRQRESAVNALRALAQWRPWPAYLFLAFALIAAASLYVAFRAFDLAAAAAGFGFALAAAGVFMTNSRLFRGPAYPFRKGKKWPFAQSEMMSVTLSKSGVFINRNGSAEVIEWQGVQEFLERRLTSYLVVTPNYAVPVPKRVFLNAEHYRAFSSFAKARLSEAARARAAQKQQRLMSSLASKPQQPAPGNPAQQRAKPNGAQAPEPKAQSTQQAQPQKAAQGANRQPQKPQPPHPQQVKPQKPAAKGAPQQAASAPQAPETQAVSTRAQLQRKPAPPKKSRPQAAAG